MAFPFYIRVKQEADSVLNVKNKCQRGSEHILFFFDSMQTYLSTGISK